MEETGQACLITSILYIITTIVILWLVNYDRLKCIFSSNLLFLFWLLVSLTTIPDVIDYSIKFHEQVNRFNEYFHINNS